MLNSDASEGLEALGTSLSRFLISPDYSPDALRGDFARFRFLLGMSDSQGVVTPESP